VAALKSKPRRFEFGRACGGVEVNTTLSCRGHTTINGLGWLTRSIVSAGARRGLRDCPCRSFLRAQRVSRRPRAAGLSANGGIYTFGMGARNSKAPLSSLPMYCMFLASKLRGVAALMS